MTDKSPTSRRYDWDTLQKDYDAGLSYRQLSQKYGVSQVSIAAAKKRGDIVTRTVSEGTKLHFEKNGANIMTDDARDRQSARMSEHNPGGRSKWFEISGKKVQGTWERDFALYLENHNIPWQRCKPLEYCIDNKIKRYTPDFYLPIQNIYIEIKGRWWGNDRKKMEAVIEQHQDKVFCIVEHTDFDKLELW